MIRYAVTNIPLAIARPVVLALSQAGIESVLSLGERAVAITVDLNQRPLLDRLLEQYQRGTHQKASEQ
jgi:hypothetical protein